MRSAAWVPLFDALSDPLAVARLAARAEEVGWHGFFVWDHDHTPTKPFDITVAWVPSADIAAYAKAGATWWHADFEPEALTVSHIRAVIDDGPVDH